MTLIRKDFSELKGKIIAGIVVDKERDLIQFRTYCGAMYEMFHEQDCCESVYIESINGDLADIEGKLVVVAEKSTKAGKSNDYSSTWTFYRIGTETDWIVIRWVGESNGYYSESVDFFQVVTAH